MAVPRGIRNNNPGNIKINPANRWRGRVPLAKNTDGVFEQFTTMVEGVRCAAVLVENHFDRRGADTPRKLISIWAPAGGENPNHERYVQFVATLANRGLPDATWNLRDPVVMYRVLRAIFDFENGPGQVRDEDLIVGMAKAGFILTSPGALQDAIATPTGQGAIAIGVGSTGAIGTLVLSAIDQARSVHEALRGIVPDDWLPLIIAAALAAILIFGLVQVVRAMRRNRSALGRAVR